MHPQHLPTYKKDFETEIRFLTRASDHYVFYYFPGSEAERDVASIVETQKEAYRKIINFLAVKEPSRPIEYYFYPDEQTKCKLMGDDWYAQSIYNEFRIHVLYTENIKPIGPHEDTHLLSLPWGLSVGFFQEGLAEYMVGHAWDKTSHETYVQKGYLEGLYPPIQSFMRHESWLLTDDTKAIYFYSLAGAFVSFLIKGFGKEAFEQFYKLTDRAKSAEENALLFEHIFKENINFVEKEFKKSLGIN